MIGSHHPWYKQGSRRSATALAVVGLICLCVQTCCIQTARLEAGETGISLLPRNHVLGLHRKWLRPNFLLGELHLHLRTLLGALLLIPCYPSSEILVLKNTVVFCEQRHCFARIFKASNPVLAPAVAAEPRTNPFQAQGVGGGGNWLNSNGPIFCRSRSPLAKQGGPKAKPRFSPG